MLFAMLYVYLVAVLRLFNIIVDENCPCVCRRLHSSKIEMQYFQQTTLYVWLKINQKHLFVDIESRQHTMHAKDMRLSRNYSND